MIPLAGGKAFGASGGPAPGAAETAPGSPAEAPAEAANYNDNTPLAKAIAAGARGAYWHILRKIRSP